MDDDALILGVAAVIAIVLLMQRWFWCLLFFFSGLAALFAMIASVIHFQILAAVGLFVIMAVCFGVFTVIFEEYR